MTPWSWGCCWRVTIKCVTLGLVACMEVLMSYSHNWFQTEVDFSTHSFASPQPVEKIPPRINTRNPRLQLKTVAVVTCHPRGVFFLSWSRQKQSPPKHFYFLCSLSQNRIFLFSFLLNHFSSHLFPPPPIALHFSSKSPLSSCVCHCIYYTKPSPFICFTYLASISVCPCEL